MKQLQNNQSPYSLTDTLNFCCYLSSLSQIHLFFCWTVKPLMHSSQWGILCDLVLSCSSSFKRLRGGSVVMVIALSERQSVIIITWTYDYGKHVLQCPLHNPFGRQAPSNAPAKICSAVPAGIRVALVSVSLNDFSALDATDFYDCCCPSRSKAIYGSEKICWKALWW